MSTILDLQIASQAENLPSEADFQLWLDTVLNDQKLSDKEEVEDEFGVFFYQKS